MNMTKENTDVLINTQKGLVHYNLSVSELVEASLAKGEGVLTESGALHVFTGKYTGRSPKDKYIVQEPSVMEHIEWGKVNQPISQAQFDRLYQKAERYISEHEVYVFDGFGGTDPEHRLPIRVINEFAWHNLFVHQLFVRPTKQELAQHSPEFTVIALPGLKANVAEDGTNSEAFIIISFERKVVLIGGTEYAGEMKKSIFSVLNYLLPFNGVMPMHCSANVGENGDVALFFGLSGTGKTTLSADPNRNLIGDDEHGWSEQGVFNFEGGCYAKCIGLSEEKEPQIWNAIRYGTVLENVSINKATRELDFDSSEVTENTRAAYPIDFIPGAVELGKAGHPNTVVFLTADAFGILPPIAKLTKEQAMYYFLSGYTSKLAGTERGVTEPEATFSTCFGQPFLPLSPNVYAEMLGRKIDEHQVNVYLVNTGWSGGPYGVGKRMKLEYTRAMVQAAINGSLEQSEYKSDDLFGFAVPTSVPSVPTEVLDPRQTWSDVQAYDQKAKELAALFVENFKKYTNVSAAIANAGPKI